MDFSLKIENHGFYCSKWLFYNFHIELFAPCWQRSGAHHYCYFNRVAALDQSWSTFLWRVIIKSQHDSVHSWWSEIRSQHNAYKMYNYGQEKGAPRATKQPGTRSSESWLCPTFSSRLRLEDLYKIGQKLDTS